MSKDIKAKDSYFTGSIGELSTNLIYRRNHVVCTSLGNSDFGEDLLCDIFSCSQENNTYVRTQFSFRTQVKSTDEIKKDGYVRKTKKRMSISISTGLLKLWEQSFYPIVLVVWECSKNMGYWCFPTEQIDIGKINHHTISILVECNSIFDDEGVQKIKQRVESYYLKIYKTNNSNFKCNIYPVWMPQYRTFTSIEIYNNIPINDSNSTRVIQYSSDMLPAFLASYHNCNIGGYIAGIEYLSDSQPLEQFWNSVYEFIAQIKPSLSNNEWIAFIISPVEIISEFDERRISNITNWTSFSLIQDRIVIDYDYTFALNDEYIFSEKIRSLSDEQELFVHSSGDFAIEIFSTGFSFLTRKADFDLISKLKRKSFCILDISKCSVTDIAQILEWCEKKGYRFIELKDDKNKIVISHRNFDISNVGVFLPGITTWKDWDDLDFESKEFLQQIPFGYPLKTKEKEWIFNKYFQEEAHSDLCLLRHSQTMYAEALVHTDRNIKFIAYVGIFDVYECDTYFEIARVELEKVLKQFELYFEVYEDLSNIILEICPEFTQPTNEAVALAEKIYHNLVMVVRKNSSKQDNMAYYVKYYLDRWIPEKFVGKR